MKIVISKAVKSDKKSVMRFYKQQNYSAGLLGFDHSYTIKFEQVIIGCVIISSLEKSNPQLFLHALVIKKEHQKQGLASQLLRYALEQHPSHQLVCFAQESLSHFYQKNSFRQITEHQLLQPLLVRYLRYKKTNNKLLVFLCNNEYL
jgi:N-acetylglutamate synthase-like GNAT family acetyltransferase